MGKTRRFSLLDVSYGFVGKIAYFRSQAPGRPLRGHEDDASVRKAAPVLIPPSTAARVPGYVLILRTTANRSYPTLWYLVIVVSNEFEHGKASCGSAGMAERKRRWIHGTS